MTRHHLEPDERTLKDHFSRELEPVLTIDPGDTVSYRLLDAGWHLEPVPTPGEPGRRFREDPQGHALVGPVAVRGARPGTALSVRVDRLVPASWGWTRSGGLDEDLYRQLDVVAEKRFLLWAIDVARGTATERGGRTVDIAPFLGVMGNAPSAPGRHATAPPRLVGGNLDCKELREGATLYLPVAVDGALFSCGDGHARQGDGEVSGTAIECPMEVAELTFDTLDEPISAPRIRTPSAWMTIGVGATLNQASVVALNGMLDLIQDRLDAGRSEALALASVAVDLRVTQIVNAGVHGVHAVLEDSALR